MRRVPEVGKRQHGHARLEAQIADRLRGEHGDLGQGFGIGIDVDGRIGQKAHAALGDHHVHPRCAAHALAHADDLERGANRGRIVLTHARD